MHYWGWGKTLVDETVMGREWSTVTASVDPSAQRHKQSLISTL